MYSLLIVDDDRSVCTNLRDLLFVSGLSIDSVHVAHNMSDALDKVRMEKIDLLISEIRSEAVDGVDLIRQAVMIQPGIQAIFISSRESFQFVRLAMRSGAKDYLVKPVKKDHLLNSIRDVLQKTDQPVAQQAGLTNPFKYFRMEEPHPDKTSLLNRLLNEPSSLSDIVQELNEKYGTSLQGPYVSIIKIKLDHSADSKRNFSAKDRELLLYAALNMTHELLDRKWRHVSFYSPNDVINIILQWDEGIYGESRSDNINQMVVIGRRLNEHVQGILGIGCKAGISQVLKGTENIGVLNEQAQKAVCWSQPYTGQFVFYYGDFNWSLHSHYSGEDALYSQNNRIVEKAKDYINQNYNQKGLTLHRVAQKNHVSPNYLSSLFKKNTGCNFWEYVIKLRMEESKKLILSTDLRRYEIAERVGYESPEHFSKIFKKKFGISPSELKNQEQLSAARRQL